MLQPGGGPVTRPLTEREVAGSTRGNDLGQVVYAHVPLSPSSIIGTGVSWEVNSKSCDTLTSCPGPWDSSIAGSGPWKRR
jgi:hypothetical protein